MDSYSAFLKALGLIGAVGTVITIDYEPILTIILVISCASISGLLTSKYVVSEAQQEVNETFQEQTKKLRENITKIHIKSKVLSDNIGYTMK